MAIACDKCSEILNEANPDCIAKRIEFQVGAITFQIIIAKNSIWNTGSLCKKCVKKLILEAVK